jgi:putative glycosyltransferase (TIGR04348 family)
VNIELVTPAPLHLNNGNRITAQRWAALLEKLGHRVRITQSYDGRRCELLLALHARRSADSVSRFQRLHPARPLVLALTGTDLYRDIRTSAEAQRSLELATRLILLQKAALRDLPAFYRPKARVIYQSAEPLTIIRPKRRRWFEVCLIAHLRAEKDPLRAAVAVRLLPRESRIRLTHIGISLDRALERRARAELARNPRYRWVGALSHRRTRERLARSDLVCITSEMEGSSNVLSEALASKVPVIATKIPGLIGTLGERFPGYFPVGDTERLSALLLRAERDLSFYRLLQRHCAGAAKWVRPERELAAWRRLLREVAR